ncbi:MAG: ABC-F family ATP-binding cassette domain-containing protein [Ruminococcaceae bacterium]|nr:ABC-F family ATP-binding cassette domain-containing protein [Oscillospiraceae bacterium]
MALLTANNVGLWFGEREIMSGVSFSVPEKGRIGLVGVNGCGKTSLFKMITGELQTDEGEIVRSRFTTIGYMEQITLDGSRTMYDEVLTVFSHLEEMEQEISRINKMLETCDDAALIEKQHQLNESFADNGGLTFRVRAKSALLGLGFSQQQLSQTIDTLSGGQRSKVQLCKLLLSGANLLLLDEPTNHLDIESTKWLENFLLTCGNGYIVISHDRYFLDRVTNTTMELENRRVTVYNGNYSRYLSLKAERRESDIRHNENTLKEIKRIEGIIDQQKRWNQERNYVTIASKAKQIERLEKELVTVEKAPDSIRFKFTSRELVTETMLTADRLAFSYGDKEIFKDLSFTVKKAERVFLIGSNGCGKSTLLNILASRMPGKAGSFTLGIGVVAGYFDQTLSSLHTEKTALDEIWDEYPRMTETQVRSAMASFLFRGDDVFRKVGLLSGGERARLALLKLMLSGANLLFLDEPTNHLDTASREALEQALSDYEGTLFIVSHDRYFINKLASRIYHMENGKLSEYLGNYDYFEEHRVITDTQVKQTKQQSSQAIEYKLRKERESALRKCKGQIERTEKRIEEISVEVDELNRSLTLPEISSDYEKVLEITNQLDNLNEEENSLYSLLEKLYEQLEG